MDFMDAYPFYKKKEHLWPKNRVTKITLQLARLKNYSSIIVYSTKNISTYPYTYVVSSKNRMISLHYYPEIFYLP